jgi:hypothetical protein
MSQGRAGISVTAGRRRLVLAAALALGLAVACIAAVPAPEARALAGGLTEGGLCVAERIGAEAAEQHTALPAPPEGAHIALGAPVTFIAETSPGESATFALASSPTLIASPDIASGAATRAPAASTASFTSSAASASPRTVYWTATISDTLSDCGEPTLTYTTPVHTFVVELPSLAFARQPALDAGGVSVELACSGPAGARCEGQALLTSTLVREPGAGNAAFALSAGQRSPVQVTLSHQAWAILGRQRELELAVAITLAPEPGGVPATAITWRLPVSALDTGRVARAIRRAMRARRHIRARVRCPGTVIQAKGVGFTCWATGTVGKRRHHRRFRTPFHVEQLDDNGYVVFHS